MMNTALSAKAEQIAQSVTFRNEKHKRFFLTYLPKCRYADVYHGGKHIALFFVEGKYHCQGIGKQLFQTVKADNMTVNSSPYAVLYIKS